MAKKMYLTSKEWGQIIAKAWSDTKFKKDLETDPANAVRKAFPKFEFQRVLQVQPKPKDLEDDEITSLAKGKGTIVGLGCGR